MANLRVLRCTQSLGWGPGQGELTGRIWSLQVSLLFLENYIVMKSARPFENQVDVHSVLPCLALTTGAWQRVMPSWSSSRRRLGWFQVDTHILPDLLVQERADWRGPKDPNGKVEDVAWWGNRKKPGSSTPATLSMYSDVCRRNKCNLNAKKIDSYNVLYVT